jgi:protein ImuA
MIRSLHPDQLRALCQSPVAHSAQQVPVPVPVATSALAVTSAPPVTFGAAAIDTRLRGGLLRGGLHEFFAAEGADGSTATGFAAMLAVRATGDHQPLLWVREDRGVRNGGALYAPGLLDLGCDPERIIIVTAADTLSLLRAGADSVRCGQAGVVVLEPWGQAAALDLTASRRLAMAAAAAGVFTLVVRVDAVPVPSAAHSRWQVAAAPSPPLAANAPGHPAFDINLLRHRGGIAGFETRLEWNRDARHFAPLSGGNPAPVVVRTDQTQPYRKSQAA